MAQVTTRQDMPTIRRGEPSGAIFDLPAPLPADYPTLRCELRLPGALSNALAPTAVAIGGADGRELRVSLTLAQVNGLEAGRVYQYKLRPLNGAAVLFGEVYCAAEWG